MSTNLIRNHCLQETPDPAGLLVLGIWSGVPEAKRLGSMLDTGRQRS
jgi:hypothetical protein